MIQITDFSETSVSRNYTMPNTRKQNAVLRCASFTTLNAMSYINFLEELGSGSSIHSYKHDLVVKARRLEPFVIVSYVS